MSTILDNRYTINGAISTDRSVLDNLSTLASACGTWITYDTHEGKFAVVINKAGTSSHSFTDDNIIGPIKLSLTPLDKIYNTVKVVYPHEDLKGKTDFIQISIPAIERLANEYENVLNLNYQVVTNPVQAQLLSFIELKQSRVDKVITFTTDFSRIGVKAGDLIDVTNATLGFTSKVFRVITVSEADSDAGAIEINITALEYDASVYNESNLSRYIRTDSDGITPLSSLQAPTKPTITKVEFGAQPSVTITTSVVTGLVESLEFWTSPDVSMSEADRLYTLLRTQPAGALTFPLNTAVSVTVDTVSSSTFVAKCRAINKDGVSEFSLPSDANTYSPVLVPGAVTDASKVTNNDGSSISGMATAAFLLKLLNSLPANSKAAGSVWDYLTGQGMANTVSASASAIAAGITVAQPSTGHYQINYSGGGGKTQLTTPPDNVVITYQFSSGLDLDIRARIVTPNVGQNDLTADCLGWSQQTKWPSGSTSPYIEWGGDNTGVGAEAVVINLGNLLAAYPATVDIVVELRAFWYMGTPNAPGAMVNVKGDFYSGGTMVISDFAIINPTATQHVELASSTAVVTTNTNVPTQGGDFISYFVYNIATKTGAFIR
jgi:hypothetical protein